MMKLDQFTLIFSITLYLIGCAPPSQPATVATHPSAIASPTDGNRTPVPVGKEINATSTALPGSPALAAKATRIATKEVNTEHQNMDRISAATEGQRSRQ